MIIIKKVILILIGIVSVWNATAQQASNTIKGTIIDLNEEPVIGATIKSHTSNLQVLTDFDGKFDFGNENIVSDTLTISTDAYEAVTVVYPDDFKAGIYTLNSKAVLKEVEIVKKKKSTEIKMFSTIKTEDMGLKELAKAACCNLSESFETTPSVDAGFTDAVSGYKQISMLGLSGPNVAFTRENIPDIRGLSAITGLTFTPGPWVESIQLSKGTGSVVNGFEGVAGQINVELLKPSEKDKKKLLLNFYQSAQGRTEANAVSNIDLKENIHTTLFAHAKYNWLDVDMNNDNFVDQPLGSTFLLGNRWMLYNKKGLEFQFGWKYSQLNNYGGNIGFNPKENNASSLWGYENNISKVDVWSKLGKVFLDKPAKSMGLQVNASYHNQDSKYGNRNYEGKQNSLYLNYIYQNIISNTNHMIKFGASFNADKYNEKWIANSYNRTETVPGAFAEYTYNYLTKVTMVAGLRADYNNIYGFFATPRLHIRYSPKDDISIRASVGRAQRTVNVLAENLGLMASNRTFEILNPQSNYAYGLAPEVAWNMGINATKKFVLNYRDGSFSVDYYYTHFNNMIQADIEQYDKVYLYNVENNSYAHSFQAQMDYEIVRNWNTRIAYRYYDVRSQYKDGIERQKALQGQHRFFINTSYETKDGWNADFTANWIGAKRIPQYFNQAEGTVVSETYSNPFWLMNAQVSKEWNYGKYKIYAGVENIMNNMQNPLIYNSATPFDAGFDASMVWGSGMGRNIYIGFNYLLR